MQEALAAKQRAAAERDAEAARAAAKAAAAAATEAEAERRERAAAAAAEARRRRRIFLGEVGILSLIWEHFCVSVARYNCCRSFLFAFGAVGALLACAIANGPTRMVSEENT